MLTNHFCLRHCIVFILSISCLQLVCDLEWLVGKERHHLRIDRMSVSSSRSFEYLESLPGTVFNKLYKQPSTALAIFRRMLPNLGRRFSRYNLLKEPMLIGEAKCFVMALLHLSNPLPVAELEAWVRSDSRPYVSKPPIDFTDRAGQISNRGLI